MTGFLRIFGFLSAFCLAIALTVGTAFADQDFAGTWKVVDTKGQAFQIMLNDDGTAAASRADEGMKGTWKADGDSAVISWDTGWTTKISKSGGGYKKTAYEKGADLSGEPTNSSDAEKVE